MTTNTDDERTMAHGGGAKASQTQQSLMRADRRPRTIPRPDAIRPGEEERGSDWPNAAKAGTRLRRRRGAGQRAG